MVAAALQKTTDTVTPLQDLGLKGVGYEERNSLKNDLMQKLLHAEKERKKAKESDILEKQPVNPRDLEDFFCTASSIDPKWMKNNPSLLVWKKLTLKLVCKSRSGLQLREILGRIYKGSHQEKFLKYSWCQYMNRRNKTRINQKKMLSKNDKDSLEQVVSDFIKHIALIFFSSSTFYLVQ